MSAIAPGADAPPPKPATSQTDVRTLVAVLVVLLAVIGFGLIVWYLVKSSSSSSEPHWQRLTYVYTGVQTVVFTAVGWLFGREVNRKHAETAQAQADSATAAEKAALVKAADLDARGRAAKAAVAARQTRVNALAEVRTRGLEEEAPETSDIDELATFMDSLFPG
jgi:hypothetical protein